MKTIKLTDWKIKRSFPYLLLMIVLLGFSQCRMDDDMNYRILIENHCDFALKVYYDNQDIEYNDGYSNDVSVTGSVSIVTPYGSKYVYSKYTSVWVEPEYDDLKSRKFISTNDGNWRKRIDVYDLDFESRY